jgi:hypothetical protein
MSVWRERDLPVLRLLDANPPQHEMLQTDWRSTAPHPSLQELTQQDFHYSVETLRDAGYVRCDKQEWEGSGGVIWLSFQVTGAGKQVLGEWPLFEVLGQPKQLAAVLDELAKRSASDEEEENLHHAAEAVRGMGGEALEQFAAGALSQLIRSGL